MEEKESHKTECEVLGGLFTWTLISQCIARIITERMAENEMPTIGEGSFLGRRKAVVLVMNLQAEEFLHQADRMVMEGARRM